MSIQISLKERQNKNFFTTFALLAKLSNIDGSVSKSEAQIINDFIDHTLQLNPKQKAIAIQIFNEEKNSAIGYTTLAKEYKQNNVDAPEILRWLLDILFKVALVNEEFDPAEEKFIVEIAKIFEIDENEFKQIKNTHIKSTALDADYEILGCLPNSPLAEVQLQYEALLKQYNPERIRQMGMPEEFLAITQEKLANFAKAFENIQKHTTGVTY
ncbi:MAG: TerB family tellurite resistance protein [Deltaproteobacteria bacterium]|jgi:DnaJ like chaperone protein|nr:TerB family tellurite resistance protein [Deltaproteobacteria bacterium]